MRTMRGDVFDSRIRSSIETGAGLNSAMTRARSSAAAGSAGDLSSSSRSSSRGKFVAPLAAQFSADDRAQHGNDIVGVGHWRGALLDQAVGAFRAWIERRARHGKNFAPLLEREPRGDQRTGTLGRFDDDDAERHTRDQPIAARKIPRPRLPSRAAFQSPRARCPGCPRASPRVRADRRGPGRRRGLPRCRSPRWCDARQRRCRAQARKRWQIPPHRARASAAR